MVHVIYRRASHATALHVWNKVLPSEQTHTVTRKSCNMITDNSCIVCPCWYPFWYVHIFPLLCPTLPSISMHASTPLPSPLLGCCTYSILPFPTLTTLPLPYTTIASLLATPHPQLHSPSLSYPTLSSLSYPSLAPPPLRCPVIPLASPTIPYPFPYLPLPYPHHSPPYSSLNSPPLCYPPFHLLPFPINPLLSSAPHPTLTLHHYLVLPSPLPLFTPLPLSPHLTYPTLQSPLPNPSHLLPSPRLPYCTLPPYPTVPFPTLPSHPLCSSPLPTLVPPPLSYPTYPRIPYHPLRSHPSRPLPSPYLPSHPLPHLSSTLPYLGGLRAERSPSFPILDFLIQPYSALHYPMLSYPLLTLSSHLLSITLPYPLSSPPYPTALLYPPHSFPYTLPLFHPLPFSLSWCTLPSNLPSPSLISSPRLGYPTLLSNPYPTILSPLLPFPRILSPTYLPTYLPSHPSPIGRGWGGEIAG